MDYSSFISWLEAVPLYGHKDGLSNIQKLLARFHHPENGPQILHVAGTNGKGSCCAMLSSILREAGFRVGLFTSPHLIHYTERIQINGEPISEEDFAALGTLVKQEIQTMVAEGENYATFFEILTAMAFLYFAGVRSAEDLTVLAGAEGSSLEKPAEMQAEGLSAKPVDYIVLETGVGGRLDATNAAEDKVLTLITSISLDHTKVLGDTVEAIAGEKAGILRPGCPVILAENPAAVQQVVAERAKALNSPYVYAPEWLAKYVEEAAGEPVDAAENSLNNSQGNLVGARAPGLADFNSLAAALPLQGSYQRQNLTAVLAGLDSLCGPDEKLKTRLKTQASPEDDPIENGKKATTSRSLLTSSIVTEGLRHVRWPGRMERLTFLGEDVLLDGCHNPGGAGKMREFLDTTQAEGTVTLLFSALSKKDVEGILAPLRDAAAVKDAVFTVIDGQDETERFVRIWEAGGKPCRVVEYPEEALKAAVCQDTRLTVVCGSLYLIGEIEEILQRFGGSSHV